MRVSWRLVSLTGVLALFIPNVTAHSKPRDGISYVSSVDNAVINTRSGRVHYLSDFELTFDLHNEQQRVKLDLRPNHDILAEGAHVQYLNSEGQVKRSEAINRQEHKVFKGRALVKASNGEWDEVGKARIYLMEDGPKPLMEGSFDILGDHHHIQLRSAYSQMRRRSDISIRDTDEESMVAYRDSDVASSYGKRDTSEAPRCGSDELSFNSETAFFPRAAGAGAFYSPSKRQSGNIGVGNLRATIGDKSGCPTDERVALVGIATDCTYTAVFNNDEALRSNLIRMVNSASEVFESSFNIALGLKNVTILDSGCPSSSATAAPWNLPCNQGDIESRLAAFSSWRGQQKDQNAYWTMMSTCATSTSVGLAWLGQLCVSSLTGYGGQSVSGANVVVRTPSEWQVFAHETGHIFGAVHDCDATQCSSTASAALCCPLSTSSCSASGQYLMSPVAGTSLTQFSPCTIGNICSGLGQNRVRDSCLIPNRNLTTITGGICGNGIVESGEDCDCGGADGCGSNPCCDGATCKFIGKSVCDDSNDSCCTSCQFTPANTVCRASTGVCDVEETCSGSDSSCPSNKYLPDGDSCGGGNGLACASGICTSRDLQCQSVFDATSQSNFTGACSTNSCTLTCVSANATGYCTGMDQNFVDGTPCYGGQFCSSGQCSSSKSNGNNGNNNNNNYNGGGGESISSWFSRNRSLVIGLSAGLGGLLLILVLCCVISCFRKRSRRKKAALMPPPAWPMMGPAQGQWGRTPSGAFSSYPGHPPPPAYPQQTYPQQAYNVGYDPRLFRTTTFRYA